MIHYKFSKTRSIQFRIFLVLAFLILNIVVIAQTQKIQLKDQTTNMPIPGATFQYGKITGITDDLGFILFSENKNISLSISHIQYGELVFTKEQVEKALKAGFLVLSHKSHMLLPVIFLQIHPNAGEKEQLTFQVQEKLAHDAGQLLEQFSSISSIRKSGAYGFDPVLRGFKYDQLNLVIDGTQCATAGCPNRMDPASSQVPLNMIVQAEVLKGPHSLRYGNAFGGTINFKSAAPHFSEQTRFQGRLGSSYETNGQISRTEAVAGLNTKTIDVKFFGSLSTGNDYSDGDNIKISAKFYRTNIGGKLGVKLNDSQNLSLLISNNFAKDVDFPALPMDLRKDDTWLINLGHEARFSNRSLSSWNSTFYATYVDHLMDNLDKELNPRMVDASTSAKTNNAGGRSELRFNFKKDWLFAGTDMRVENAEGTRERNILMGNMAGRTFLDNVWQDGYIRKNGLFAEYHHQRTSYHLVFSARMELNHAEAKDLDENFASFYTDSSSDFVNPSFSIGGTKLLTESASLGLWVGTAQRSGGLAERYINLFPIGLDPYEMLGNPELKPETNNQIDLIFSHKNEKTDFNINLFSSFLRNSISSEIRDDIQPRMVSSAGVRQFINIDKALVLGFEVRWEQSLGHHIQHIAELAYTHGQNTTTEEALPEIPPMEFDYRLIGSFLKNRLQGVINFRHAFKQNRIAESYGETKTPAFNVIDLKTSYLLGKYMTLSAGAQNLLNEAYYEHLARSVRSAENRPIYSPGRSFYFSLSYRF